jgi:hypothetical protein
LKADNLDYWYIEQLEWLFEGKEEEELE